MTLSPNLPPPPSLMRRLATELKRLVVMAVVVGLILVAGKYYCFDRLDEEIRARLQTQLREHYRGLAVSVQSARRIPGRGIEIRGIRIAMPGRQETLLAEVDELFAACDTRLPDFLTQPPAVQSVQVQRLKLRAERLPSGHWNLQGLLPMPQCGKAAAPRATVTDAAIEFVDATQNPPCSWTLRNIGLTVTPRVVKPSNSDDAAVTTLVIHGSVAGDHFEKLEFDATLDPQSGAWDLRGEVAGLEFSPRLRAALPRELSESLVPLASIRGRTQFGFHARRAASLSGQIRQPLVQFVIQGEISEGRIDDTRLPEPFTDVAAKVRFDNQGLRIDELSGRCGSTQIQLKAAVAGYEAGSPLSVQLDARQVQLERLPVGSLPAEVQAAFQRFSPRGVVDISGHLNFDGRRWLPNLTIRCHDLSIQYVGFPYRAGEGKGTIELTPGAIVVRLRMIGGGQTIHCRADVQNPGPDFTGWIEVQSEGAIAIDDKLIAAMELSAQRVVRSFHPRGAVSFQGCFQRDPGEATLHRKLSINLHDCSIQHDKFRYPIDKVGGALQLNDGTWRFRNLTGRNDSAQISGEGSWQDDPESGRILRLTFNATDVPLAEELRQALGPGAQRLWSNLRPRGNLDHLNVGMTYLAREQRLSVEVQADKFPPDRNVEGRPLSIEPSWFRYRLDNLAGSFHYRDGQLELKNLHAAHNRTQLSAEATCQVGEDGACQLDFTRLAADRLEVDQDLLAALPERMGAALSRTALSGPLNLMGRLGITVPKSSDLPPELSWDLSLDLENGRIAAATPLEHIHGSVRLIGSSGAAGINCRGELFVDSAIVRGVQLTHLEGPLWTNGERLVFGSAADLDVAGRRGLRQLSARLLGGQITAGGAVALVGDGGFHVAANLERADLAEIARQLAPQQRGLSGKVFASAGLSGTNQGIHTWRGGGQVRLRDADIYELPVMIALLKLLSVQRADRTAFTTSDIDFRIEGDDLAFERIDFSGDAISLKGKGRMNAQREIDLKFHPLMGREERFIPLVRPIVGETGRQFMLIEVTGNLAEPHVKRTVFPRLDEQLEQLFPELAREELMEPAKPLLSLPQATLERLNLLPKR